MRTNWTLKLCVPLASAAVLVGCTQEVGDDQTQNRTPIDNATNQQRQNLRISVIGCLGIGSGTQQFVLNHVRPAPLAEQPSDALSAANFSLPNNSAVRLVLNEDQQVAGLVGQEVSVTGLLTSTGADTIGTAGRPPIVDQRPEKREDKSLAASDLSYPEKVAREAGPIGQDAMNNGTYPEMTVQQVRGTGEKCVTSPVDEKR